MNGRARHGGMARGAHSREDMLLGTGNAPSRPEDAVFGRGAFHEVVMVVDESTGNRKHQFLNGPQADMVLADEVFSSSGSPDDILWLLQDHQNSVTDVATIPASGQAQLVNHIEYNAFGAITSQTNSSYQPLQTYAGQIQDDAVDLLYYDARWYDPQLAQFTSEDPIDFLGGDANLFRYVGNSTPNAVDPSGLAVNNVAKAIKNRAKRDAYRIFKERLKSLTSRGLVQIHHVIMQKFFDDPNLGPWLKKLGVFKNELANVIPLPTVAGAIEKSNLKGGAKCVAKKVTEKTIHQGYHIDEYVEKILEELLEIKLKHDAKLLSDEGAKLAIEAFQSTVKKQLRTGAIKLIDESSAIQKYMERSAMMAAVACGGNREEYDSMMDEAGDRLFAEIELNARQYSAAGWASAETWTGSEGAKGWIGWGVDMFNPAAYVSDAFQLEYIHHVSAGGGIRSETPSAEAARIHREVTGKSQLSGSKQ